jgi:hypothetical protein
MKKLTVILGMVGVFALGCATASVLVDNAEATPPAGSTQCVAISIGWASSGDVEKGKHEERATVIPAGWTPVGGASGGNQPAVVVCRAAG